MRANPLRRVQNKTTIKPRKSLQGLATFCLHLTSIFPAAMSVCPVQTGELRDERVQLWFSPKPATELTRSHPPSEKGTAAPAALRIWEVRPGLSRPKTPSQALTSMFYSSLCLHFVFQGPFQMQTPLEEETVFHGPQPHSTCAQ